LKTRGAGTRRFRTESYKDLDPDTRTLVDQVRHYRNWVAHGRRGLVKNNVDPEVAIRRLEKFLELLDADSAAAAASILIDPIAPPPDDSHEMPLVND
jgi:hypothetical protein